MDVIIKPVCLVPLLLAALTLVAAAQTTPTAPGVAGTGLANPYGAVALPTTSGVANTTQTSSVAPPSGTTSGGSTTGGSATGSNYSAASGSGARSGAGSGSTNSVSGGSGGSSGAGTSARSGSIPGWLVCPPTGATGFAPFVDGTSLSCAP